MIESDAQPVPFGQVVRELRLRRGMTLAEFGAAVNRSESRICHIEAGRGGALPLPLIARMAEVLGVKRSVLLKGAVDGCLRRTQVAPQSATNISSSLS